MSFPKKFRYSLTYQDTVTYLKYDPDTWEDFSLEWKQQPAYWTRAVTVSLPIKFVKDGKAVIDNAYRIDGVSANVVFCIEVFNYDTQVWMYETIYQNRLDFAKYKSSRDYVEVEAIEQGLMALLSTKREQEFEIDMTSPTRVEYDRIVFNQFCDASFGLQTTSIPQNGTIYVTCDITKNGKESIITAQDEKKIEVKSVAKFQTNDLDGIIKSDLYAVKCNESVANVTFDFTNMMSGYINASSSGVTLSLQIVDSDKNTLYEFDTYNWILTEPNMYYLALDDEHVYITPPKAIISLSAGKKYFVVLKITSYNLHNYFSAGVSINRDSKTPFLKWDYRGKVVSINTITPLQLGQRLMEKITQGVDGVYNFASPILQQNAEYSITCGNAIRRLYGAKIKTTFEDFYKSYSSIFQLGCDVVANPDGSETVMFMPLSHFFQDTEIASLGEVTDLRISPYTDKLFNTINIGYQDNNYDNADGRGEFNTELEFSVPFRTIKKSLSLMSPYRADSYGVEYVVIEFEEKDSTDSSTDNDTFIIKRKGAGIDRTMSIGGTYADKSMFNAKLSPKQNLLRNAGLISSLVEKVPTVDDANIIFGSSKKDGDVLINFRAERASELINAPKLFRPFIFEFYTGLNHLTVNGKKTTIYQVMRDNPNGYFSFSYNKKTYKGYVLNLMLKPATKMAQEWILLAHPTVEI